MGSRTLKLAASWCAVLALAVSAPAVGQQPAPVPVLLSQPDSPLQIVSMRPIAAPAAPAGTPARFAEAMASYELVLRNKSDVPIMAWAISHEAQVGTGLARTCQGSAGFREPMIAARETKTIYPSLHKHASPTFTPVIDLVLLQDGSYFGKDTCRNLADYQTKLDTRRTTLSVVMRLLRTDGADATALWIKQELDRDVQPLMNPRKIGQ